MKKISGLIIAITLSSFIYADGHKDEKKDHPNKLMSGKECIETRDGVAWFLSTADNVFDEIKEYGDMKDKAWNDRKWAEAISLSDLASNYSTVYEVWCKDMINNRMKMRMKEHYKDHKMKKDKKKD
tara:strand:+ start:72 stop:449 length:378 start_codon:yes stop_codon:yes gene_type:complete